MMRNSVITLIALLFAFSAMADGQYSVAPRMNIYSHADDNLLLGSATAIQTWGTDTGLSFDMKRQSERLTTDLAPRVNLRRFVVNSGFDADEYGARLNNMWKDERFSLGLDVGYLRDSTLITEATDSGLTNDVVNRDSIDVTPTLVWLVNDRWQAQFSMSYNDISYANGATTGLLDYRYLMGSSTVTYACDATTQIFSTLFSSDFDVPIIGNHTRTYGVEMGMTKILTETISVTGAVGYVSSDIESVEQRLQLISKPPPPHLGVIEVPVSTNSTGPIANFSLQKQLATSSLAKLDYSRQLSPGGRGAQTIADHIAVRTDLKLKGNWLLTLSGSHDMRNSEGGVTVSDTDRDYTEGRTTLSYKLAREWTVSGFYRFAYRKNTGLSTASASGHGIALTIEYNGLERPLSFINGL